MANIDPFLTNLGAVAAGAKFVAKTAAIPAGHYTIEQLIAYLNIITVHENLTGLDADDHPQYHTDARGDARYSALGHGHSIGEISGLSAILADTQPLAAVLTATTASFTITLEGKLAGIAAGATSNSSDAYLLARANHTGTQAVATVSGLQAALDAKATLTHSHAIADVTGLTAALAAKSDTSHSHSVATTVASGFLSASDKIKLSGIAAGATANSSDAALLARANHTGTQAIATVSGLQAAIDAKSDLGHSHAGLVLAGGTTGQVLKKIDGTDFNYSWQADATGGGGGGSPGGSITEVQYNNGAGGFLGATNVKIESDNLKLVNTTDPAAPTAGLILYAKSIAGKSFPKIIGPSGIDTALQEGLHGNAVFMVAPASGTTAPTVWGGTLTTAATMSVQQTIASANPWLATWRKRFATSTTAGNLSGMRTAYAQWFRGNVANFGGFFFRTQLGHNINLNGSQLFVGLCASTVALASTAGSVAALLNAIGMGYDTTDANTGNWFLYTNDGTGTATKTDLGAGAARSNVSHGYDLIIHCPPGAATAIYVRVVNIHTNAVVFDGSFTTDLPAVNTGLAYKAEINNGAVAAAANLEIAKAYVMSDY